MASRSGTAPRHGYSYGMRSGAVHTENNNMWCPKCGMDTRVVETEKLSKTVSRVRWCRNPVCRHLFETHEVLAIKKGRRAEAASTLPPTPSLPQAADDASEKLASAHVLPGGMHAPSAPPPL